MDGCWRSSQNLPAWATKTIPQSLRDSSLYTREPWVGVAPQPLSPMLITQAAAEWGSAAERGRESPRPLAGGERTSPCAADDPSQASGAGRGRDPTHSTAELSVQPLARTPRRRGQVGERAAQYHPAPCGGADVQSCFFPLFPI